MERILTLDDIDAAGVAFGPRLIALAHQAFESACAEAGMDLPTLLRVGRWALPLVKIESEFTVPLRHGDRVLWTVALTAISERSATVRIEARCLGRTTVVVEQTHVCLDRESGRSSPWPEHLRSAWGRFPGAS